MRYFQISLDVELTGVKNGLHQIDINKSSLEKDERFKLFFETFDLRNVDFWNNQQKLKDIKIPVIKAKLLKKAKLTDIMGYTQNISYLYLVYSKKFIDIIKLFNLGNYYTFEMEIDSIEEKFYLIFFETIILHNVYFEKSLIFKGLNKKTYVDFENINNYKEYYEFTNINPIHNYKKIAISKEHYGKDIIKIQATSKLFYSEKLLNFLLDSGITGIKIDIKNSIQLEFV